MNLREAINTFRGHRAPHFRIIPKKRWWFLLSGFFILLSLVGLFVRGLNFSIDFKGGALLQYPEKKAVTPDQVREVMAKFHRPDAEVQITGGKNGNQITIKTRSLTDLGERPGTLFTVPNKGGVSLDAVREVFDRYGRGQISLKTSPGKLEIRTSPVPEQGLGQGIVLAYPDKAKVPESDVSSLLAQSGRNLAHVSVVNGTVIVHIGTLKPQPLPTPGPSASASATPSSGAALSGAGGSKASASPGAPAAAKAKKTAPKKKAGAGGKAKATPTAAPTPTPTPAPSPTPSLTPQSSAKAVLAALAKQAGVKPGDIEKIDLTKATRTDLVTSLASALKVAPGDIKIKEISGRQREKLLSALAAQAGVTTAEINIQDVGPTWGGQISKKAVQALIIFLILVTIYISFRFEWKMALAAQTALLHDLIITAGIYALVGREVTPATVIAILTILGYSLYDTVVIFDRVKENTESLAMVTRDTYSGVVNNSLNETLMRSVNTSLVVLLPILSLLLFGGATLKDFAFALFVGVASGTYSSIFIASPVLALLKEREPRYAKIRQRALTRPGRPTLRAVPASTAALPVGEDGEVEPAPKKATAAAGQRPGASSGSRSSGSRSKKKRKPPSSKRRRR